MQIRVAAKYLGYDPENLSTKDQLAIIGALNCDASNLRLAARHLCDLVAHDFPNQKLMSLRDEQVRIVATRYNRGTRLSLYNLKRNTSYGNKVVDLKQKILRLLNSKL